MSAQYLLAWSPFDPWHLLFFGVVALLLFGKRLPEVGRSLGRGIMEFKKGLSEVQEELNREDKPKESPRLKPPQDSVSRTEVKSEPAEDLVEKRS